MTQQEINGLYRDTDMDGLPDRIDSAPTIPQYHFQKVTPDQLDYLRDFAQFRFAIQNHIVRVDAEDKDALKRALEAQELLAAQYAECAP